MKNAFYITLLLCLWAITMQAQTVTDADGNVYKTVTIGGQTWMAENLQTTKYNDGTEIPLVTNNIKWITLMTAGVCWFENKQETYQKPYGAIYNWYAVGSQKLCPKNWHVPSDADWKTLIEKLGGNRSAGLSLKEAGNDHWLNPNANASNTSGFTALPGGFRNMNGIYTDLGNCGYYWSTREGGLYDSYCYFICTRTSDIATDIYNKTLGFSVRCVKD